MVRELPPHMRPSWTLPRHIAVALWLAGIVLSSLSLAVISEAANDTYRQILWGVLVLCVFLAVCWVIWNASKEVICVYLRLQDYTGLLEAIEIEQNRVKALSTQLATHSLHPAAKTHTYWLNEGMILGDELFLTLRSTSAPTLEPGIGLVLLAIADATVQALLLVTSEVSLSGDYLVQIADSDPLWLSFVWDRVVKSEPIDGLRSMALRTAGDPLPQGRLSHERGA